MRKSLLSVSHRGLRDWILQRASAVYLVAYLFVFFVLLIQHSPVNFMEWKAIFEPIWFKISTVLAFVCILVHTWVGIWTIFTDYVHPWKARFILLALVFFLLFFYFIWFIQIIGRL